MRIYHHSRSVFDREPNGAVPCGGTLTLCCDFEPDGEERLQLYLCDLDGCRVLPMSHEDGRARISIVLPAVPQRVGYCFQWEQDGKTFYYGAVSGEGRIHDTPVLYGITLYDKSFETPAWFRHGVAYQIFPDRFCCSDRDAFLARAEAYRASGRAIFVHESWDEDPLYLPHDGAKHYQPDDYFGGDLEGIRQKLPYLASLGVTCLYLNPIFAAHSNHRYNTADYLSVDPLLGTNDDFIRLAEDAGAHGIRIVLDGVFSHTGDDSIYFDRYGRYGNGACVSTASPYFDWYRFHHYPDDYECWWNFETLPNVEELTPSYVDFIQGENGVLKTWLRRGASGWRLDVADELPDPFICGIRRAIKSENPNAVLIGEVWEDCSTKTGPDGRRGYCNGDSLDAPMNYPHLRAVLAFFRGEGDAYLLADRLQQIRENYPKPFYEACLNLLGSHDIGRVLSALAGAPDSETAPREEQLAFRPDASALARAKRLYAAAFALTVALPGVPCIYYGDEAGVLGLRDPFNRKTYPWTSADQTLIESIGAIARTRQTHPAPFAGRLRMGALGADLFCVIRYADESVLLTLVNRSECRVDATLFPALLFEGPDGAVPVPFAGTYVAEDGERIAASASIRVSVPPFGFRILTKS